MDNEGGRRQERERQALAPPPLRDQHTPSAPKDPGENRPAGPAGGKGSIGMPRGEKGTPLRMGPKPSREAMPALCRREPTFGAAERTDGTRVRLWDPTPERCVPLALASLVLGSATALGRLCEMRSAKSDQGIAGHGTH
jgi:hypothetical protein